MVVENVQHTLQKRTFRKGERRNKRREEGRANAACVPPCYSVDDELICSVSRGRGRMAEIASAAIDVEASSTADEDSLAAAGCI